MAKKQEPALQPEFKPIERGTLMAFVADIDTAKEKRDDAAMAIAACYKEHKNAFGLHTEAFKLIYKLLKKDVDARADFLRAFDEYRDTMGLDDQLDLFESGAANDSDAAPAMAAAGAMH